MRKAAGLATAGLAVVAVSGGSSAETNIHKFNLKLDFHLSLPGDLAPPNVQPTPPEALTATKDDDVRLCGLVKATYVEAWKSAQAEWAREIRESYTDADFREFRSAIEKIRKSCGEDEVCLKTRYSEEVLARFGRPWKDARLRLAHEVDRRWTIYGRRGIAARTEAGPEEIPDDIARSASELSERERGLCDAYVGTRLND